MRPRGFFQDGSLALALLLFYGILTLWIGDRWALSLYQAAALLACGAWGIWMTFHPERARWTILLIPVALVPVWGLVQLASARTVYRWETWNSILNWTTNFAIFLLAFQLLSERQRRERFLKWLLYFGAGLSILSTVQMFTSDGKIFWLFPSGYTDFVLGPFVYKNQYAAFIETVLPLALYHGITHRRPFQYWAMAGVMVASVVASASRAGTILVLMEVVVVPLLASARGRFPLRNAVSTVGSAVALSLVFTTIVGWDVIWNRFQESDAVRQGMFRSSVHMVVDRPAMGFGLGTWSTAYPAYALYDDGLFANQAHDDWAQWAVEGGLPLLGAMALFALLLAGTTWNSPWGFGVISVLLHSFVDYPMQQRPALAGWFFAMAGALAAARVVKKASVSAKQDGGTP